MFTRCLEQMSSIYNNMDSILITNREGIIEYASLINAGDRSINNEGYTGQHLLTVYPDLTEETSTIFRVMKTGKPIADEVQTLTDWNGKTLTFSCSTYPIGLGDKIIGAVEGVILLTPDGRPLSKAIGRRENRREKGERLYRLEDLITVDPHMKRIKEQLLRTSDSDSPVMIIGDTGTGKELAAQSIHSHSPRAEGPFISQNCSAIPMGLLESTLFGTIRGSYTGAEDRKGLFELADGGTLFLDELNSMDIGLQGKILKAVEEQKIRRVGDGQERRINVRVVSAVNRDPKEAMEAGELRKDLYYRLSVVQIRLPLLRERKRDIPVLIRHYIDYYNRKEGRNIRGCSEVAQKLLLNYSWPGNVRELRNVIEYAFHMAKGTELTVQDIPEHLLYDRRIVPDVTEAGGRIQQKAEMKWEEGRTLPELVEGFEADIIRQACGSAHNMTAAAKKLGISRQALRYKMVKYGLL